MLAMHILSGIDSNSAGLSVYATSGAMAPSANNQVFGEGLTAEGNAQRIVRGVNSVRLQRRLHGVRGREFGK